MQDNYEIETVEGGAPIKMWTRGVPVEPEARRQLASAAKLPAVFHPLRRWERAAQAPRLSVRETLALVDDAAALCEEGVLRRREVLGARKNRALRQCGESVRIDRLARAIAGLRPRGEVAS